MLTRRRVVAIVVTWALVVGLARTVVALPERCPPVTSDGAREAAQEAVRWFARNQRPDGRWVYQYDRAQDSVDLRSHVVRHSGVALSLYQAHAAGIGGALAVADQGVEWSLDQVVERDGWIAVRRGNEVPTGATALLAAGLAVRRLATDDARYDSEMAALGRFLTTMTERSGAVQAAWDVGTGRPVPGVYSPFFTGESFMALALLGAVDGDDVWQETAQRIGRYLAVRRDRAEGRFPPVSDHWAAYGLAQLGQETGPGLGSDERDYADRLAGIFGVQVRYESQRTDAGLNAAVLRGPRTVGAGLGTLGEGLGSLWQLAADGSFLADVRPVLGERLRCVAGMLVDRQVDTDGAASTGQPGLARGAWFHADVTQMDDQQHALSALLLAAPTVAEGGDQGQSTGDDGLGRVLWLAAVAGAVAAPERSRRMLNRARPPQVVAGVLATLACLVPLALGADALLRAMSVSPPTALVAAGLVVAASAAGDLVRPPRQTSDETRSATEEWGLPGVLAVVLRPALALLVLAVAGDVGPAAGVVVATAGAAAALVALRHRGQRDDAGTMVAWTALRWATAAVALLGAVDLVVDGVLAI